MAISEADKIRRAEEIYYKRRYNKDYRSISSEPPKKKKSFILWAIGKIVYISLIVSCVYAYNNKDYFLSEQFKKDFNSFVNKPMNMNTILEILDSNFNNNELKEKDSSNEIDSNNTSVNKITENGIVYVNEISAQLVKTTNIKSKNEKVTIQEIIKNNCKFKLPLKGTITSRFGNRESTYANVSKNHTGIDISAKYGTDIKSAVEGKVIEVSSVGNYGKHLKIESVSNPDVVTLYAHCSKILVKKGDKVKIGDKIAKVGNTGNVTGTHLHFEIRYKNKCINPDTILEF